MKRSGFIKTALLISFSLFLYPALCQVVSYPVTYNSIDRSSEGIIYALPAHSIKVKVTVTKSEKFKGKYSDHATKLLGITEIINKDNTTYEITDVQVSTFSDIDTSQVYYAQFPAKLADDQTLMINLTEKGILSGFISVKEDEKEIKAHNLNGQPFRDLLKPVLIEKVDTIIRRVSIDTTIIEEKVLKRSISEKSNEQQAREIADLIYRIEDSKFSLITGYQEVNYSKETIQYMLTQLNKMEKEYLAYFKGSELLTQEEYIYTYTPAPTTEATMFTLFRFSTSEGISDKDTRTGEPVYVSINAPNKLANARKFENERMQAKRKAKGIYYRIPESTHITIQIGNRVLATHQANISQLGILTFLPSSNLSKIDFDDSGALRSLILQE